MLSKVKQCKIFLESVAHSIFSLLAPNIQIGRCCYKNRVGIRLMRNRLHKTGTSETGFSLVEMMVAMVILVIMSAIAVPYLLNYKKAFKSEEQAIKVIDLMRETSQLALSRRRTIRFEIDYTDNVARIIDENNAAADTLIKKIPLEPTREVRMDILPATITKPNPPNYTDLAATTDPRGHMEGSTSVSGHSVWQARFRSDGSVANHTDVPINVNIYSWPPLTPGSTTPKTKDQVRAITLFGGSGAIRYWKHNGTAFVSNQ